MNIQDLITYSVLIVTLAISLYKIIVSFIGPKNKFDLTKSHCHNCSLRELHGKRFDVIERRIKT